MSGIRKAISVGSGELQDDSVSSSHIIDETISVADIGPNAVGTSELVNNSVTQSKLDSGIPTLSLTLARGDQMASGQQITAAPGVDVTIKAPLSKDLILQANGATMLTVAAATKGLQFSSGVSVDAASTDFRVKIGAVDALKVGTDDVVTFVVDRDVGDAFLVKDSIGGTWFTIAPDLDTVEVNSGSLILEGNGELIFKPGGTDQTGDLTSTSVATNLTARTSRDLTLNADAKEFLRAKASNRTLVVSGIPIVSATNTDLILKAAASKDLILGANDATMLTVAAATKGLRFDSGVSIDVAANDFRVRDTADRFKVATDGSVIISPAAIAEAFAIRGPSYDFIDINNEDSQIEFKSDSILVVRNDNTGIQIFPLTGTVPSVQLFESAGVVLRADAGRDILLRTGAKDLLKVKASNASIELSGVPIVSATNTDLTLKAAASKDLILGADGGEFARLRSSDKSLVLSGTTITSATGNDLNINVPSGQRAFVSENAVTPFAFDPSAFQFGHDSSWFLCANSYNNQIAEVNGSTRGIHGGANSSLGRDGSEWLKLYLIETTAPSATPNDAQIYAIDEGGITAVRARLENNDQRFARDISGISFTITNDTQDLSFDANATTIDELADVVSTLIRALANGRQISIA